MSPCEITSARCWVSGGVRGDLITASSDNGRKDRLFALLVRGGYSVAITDPQIFRQFFQERLAAAELAPLRKAAL